MELSLCEIRSNIKCLIYRQDPVIFKNMKEKEKIKTDYENMKTELHARIIIFHDDEWSRGFNEGLKWALRLVEDYEKGEGLFQQ